MSQFDHVNVLNLMAIIWEQGEPPAVVTPYMGKGSLLDLIRKSDMVSLDLLRRLISYSASILFGSIVMDSQNAAVPLLY